MIISLSVHLLVSNSRMSGTKFYSLPFLLETKKVLDIYLMRVQMELSKGIRNKEYNATEYKPTRHSSACKKCRDSWKVSASSPLAAPSNAARNSLRKFKEYKYLTTYNFLHSNVKTEKTMKYLKMKYDMKVCREILYIY